MKEILTISQSAAIGVAVASSCYATIAVTPTWQMAAGQAALAAALCLGNIIYRARAA